MRSAQNQKCRPASGKQLGKQGAQRSGFWEMGHKSGRGNLREAAGPLTLTSYMRTHQLKCGAHAPQIPGV